MIVNFKYQQLIIVLSIIFYFGFNYLTIFAIEQKHLIAINNWDYPYGRLKTPKDDASVLKSVFSKHYGFQTHSLKNLPKALLLNELKQLAKQSKQDNWHQLVFYYGGHANYDDTRRVDPGYWLTIDNQMFLNSEIQKILDSFRAQHTLLFVNACFGGRLLDSTKLSTDPLPSEIFSDQSDSPYLPYENLHLLESQWLVASSYKEPTADEAIKRLNVSIENSSFSYHVSPFIFILYQSLTQGFPRYQQITVRQLVVDLRKRWKTLLPFIPIHSKYHHQMHSLVAGTLGEVPLRHQGELYLKQIGSGPILISVDSPQKDAMLFINKAFVGFLHPFKGLSIFGLTPNQQYSFQIIKPGYESFNGKFVPSLVPQRFEVDLKRSNH